MHLLKKNKIMNEYLNFELKLGPTIFKCLAWKLLTNLMTVRQWKNNKTPNVIKKALKFIIHYILIDRNKHISLMVVFSISNHKEIIDMNILWTPTIIIEF